MSNKYQVYVVQAYSGQVPSGDLLDVVILELIDTSVASAMKRAKELLKDTDQDKKFMRLARVIEKTEE